MSQRNETRNERQDGAADQDTNDDQPGLSTGNRSSGASGAGNRIATWFAASALRIGVALVGFVILLVALGELVGMNLLDLAVDALSSSIGRWLAVAVFALVLIALALRGFGVTTT